MGQKRGWAAHNHPLGYGFGYRSVTAKNALVFCMCMFSLSLFFFFVLAPSSWHLPSAMGPVQAQLWTLSPTQLAEDLDKAKDRIDPNTLYNTDGSLNLWDIFPPTANCLDLVRLGRIGDGGKWVCGLSKPISGAPRSQVTTPLVVYSFGVSSDISFEVELLKQSHLNAIVFAFDPTIGQLPPVDPLSSASLRDSRGKSRIYFSKLALGTGPKSSTHLLSEHIYDIMRGLNHTHIDLLKVDIEGGEWGVFEELFSRLSVKQSLSTLPFRQISIELHYQDSLERVNGFFQGMTAAGFVPVSREINLQPCSAGKIPAAAEYTFVNTRFSPESSSAAPFFEPKANQAQGDVSLGKVRSDGPAGVIYLLSQKARLSQLLHVLQSLQKNFLSDFPGYPVVVFHDDLSERDVAHLTLNSISRPRGLYFSPIKFALPDTMPASRRAAIPERTACTPNISTMGYRHMCRFHATAVHTALEQVRGLDMNSVEYIWRLDDDSVLVAPIGYDLFELMKRNGKMYGFVSHLSDEPVCVDGLWAKARAFVSKWASTNSTPALRNATSFFHTLPERYTFYNNFEISHVSVWKSPIWKAFMAAIDEDGGIYLRRWGDAPIHTIAASLVLSLAQIHRFTDLGYQHAPFINQQPSGLPPPSMNPLLPPDQYRCQFFEKWNCNVSSVGMLLTGKPSRSASSLPHKPAWIDDEFAMGAVEMESSALVVAVEAKTRFKTKSSGAISMGSDVGASKGRIALYTFATGGSETVLAATMASFYENFARNFTRQQRGRASKSNTLSPVSFVIFHSSSGKFSAAGLTAALKQSSHRSALAILGKMPLVVTPVKIQMATSKELEAEAAASTNASSSLCMTASGEMRGASMFLRRRAAAALDKMGFRWMFRFGLDSALHRPLAPDLFRSLEAGGVKYAYASQVLDTSRCASTMWRVAAHLCEQTGLAAGSTGPLSSTTLSPRQLPACSPGFAAWPKNVIFFTSFEISEVSLWRTPLCEALFDQVEREPGHAEFGDAALHTLCALISLPKTQMRKLTDVLYEGNLAKLGIRGAGAKVPEGAALTSSSKYALKSLPQLDRLFEPQRFGWLGGDVAASVALPPLQPHSSEPEKYLWLFGDSLVGTSSASARLEGEMVSNTVAVATVPLSARVTTSVLQKAHPGNASDAAVDALSLRFYWGQSARGAPRAVLELSRADPPLSQLQQEQQQGAGGDAAALGSSAQQLTFWPLGGLAVQSPGAGAAGGTAGGARLLVIGPVVRPTLDALGFQDEASALFVVDNPRDPPHDWRYRHDVFEGRHFKWVALSQEDGAAYAGGNPEDWLLLFGVFSPAGFLDHQSWDFFSLQSQEEYQVLGRIRAGAAVRLELGAVQVLCSSSAGAGGGGGGAAAGEQRWLPAANLTFPGSGAGAGAGAIESANKPVALFRPSVSEMSVSRGADGAWQVTSLRMMANRVKVCRTAPRASAAGPYTCVHSAPLPSPWDSKDYNTYAAKAHPELLRRGASGVGSFVLSIVSNPVKGPGELFGQPRHKVAYCPRFFLAAPADEPI